jgi:tetraacyldisaccharide 4'-kinase
VISIGNIAAGGTGKTPMAIHVAQLLLNNGVRAAVLSRGYRRARTGGGDGKTTIVSDGVSLKCPAVEAGDEAYLMASRLLGSTERPGTMVIVGRDRVAGASKAVELGAQAIVLDDGFQHRRLARDLDLVLLDAERPFGNGWLLPAGRLREPKSALRRASAIVLTRCAPGGVQDGGIGWLERGKPFFCTRHAAAGLRSWPSGKACDAGGFKGKRLLLFSGIARPDSFARIIRDLGLDCGEQLSFGDHHNYRRSDLGRIEGAARSCDAVVTTEKDAVRLPEGWDAGRPLYVLRIGIELVKGADRFERMILSVVQKPA